MTQEDKLNILKEILLTDEREFSLSIEKKIKLLEETINQQNKLSTKVDPIINEKLDEFVKEIPETLGPTITATLKSEIKNSQDAVVEALFPIIGKMIKKYVQQEMRILSDRINEQTNRFTFKSLKRRFFAKKHNVSEGDLILQEQIKPLIEQFIVIEKGSGLVVAEFSKTNNIDQDMVAAMLTAIKSFAEDAFSKENQSLEYIQYETYHIHIQNFSSYYIAVVISGVYNSIFKSELEDNLLDFAQNFINQEDVANKDSFSKKLQSYFNNEDF